MGGSFFALIFCLTASVAMSAISGNVEKNGVGDFNQVIDSQTQKPIPQADITMPSKGYKTKTDSQGRFSLGAKIDAPTIMSVQKDGYKPFSLTVDSSSLSRPIVVGIEKESYPHLDKMNPIKTEEVGKKDRYVAVFYECDKNNIAYKELYEHFISISEQVINLGIN